MKRFTETDKWKDTWFRKLKPAEKLMWLYILDSCDNAGFFELDVEMCSFITGMEEDRVLGAVKGLDRGLIGAKQDGFYYVKNFLKHQKNTNLNPENNAHKQIIALIAEHRSLFSEKDQKLLGAKQGLNSPTGKGRVKVEDKVKDYTADFLEFWKCCGKGSKPNAFKNWKSESGKPVVSELITIYARYKAHCEQNERTLRDTQGWISGRMWETEWSVAKSSDGFDASQYE